MSLGDVIGPVMIGPSSSHTAGAARLGDLARICLGAPLSNVKIFLRGSFLKTAKGHGTDKALLAGLMGFQPDDPRIRDAFNEAGSRGLVYSFMGEDVDGAHPNSVRFEMFSSDGQTMEVTGASIGGGAVEIREIDGFKVNISGEYPTLVTCHKDVPGVVASLSHYLAGAGINIATVTLSRKSRSGMASMVVEMDNPISQSDIDSIVTENNAVLKAFVLHSDGGDA